MKLEGSCYYAALLDAAESHPAGLGGVRISALAANAGPRALYERRGYRAHDIVFEKKLGDRTP